MLDRPSQDSRIGECATVPIETDALAADALRHASGLVVVVDRRGSILVVNDNWSRLAADFDGDPQRCGPGANYFEVCRQAAAGGEAVAQQVLDACQATLADRTLRVVEYACAPPFPLAGPPSFWYRLRIAHTAAGHLLLEHTDVTDERAKLLRATEVASQAAFERLVLTAIAQPVIATDLEGIVTYWNDAATAFFGYRADEAIGQPIVAVTVPETSVEQATEIMATLSRGESWTGEFWVRHRDGTRFPARVTDIPMVDADGHIVGIVGISDDLRPHYAREAEQQRLRDLENQLLQSQKLEALGTVAGGVAHEFNNVLAAILGHAELLRDDTASTPAGRVSAEDIVEATQRGRDVVHSLLAFGRPQSGERSPFVVEVTDSGTGMDEAALARAFAPFFTTKPIGDGTGLGLAVVHGLVQAHGGTIAVTSTPGIGTSVQVRLPVSTLSLSPPAPSVPPVRLAEAPAVLLVDDDPMVLRAITRILESGGARVTGFTDAKAAAHAIVTAGATLPWSVAIFDYAMPVMRGDELALALAHAGHKTPVILCSGNIGDIGLSPAGVREVLEKPVGGQELLDCLRRVLGVSGNGAAPAVRWGAHLPPA